MNDTEREESSLLAVALQNANAIHAARQRAEQELIDAKKALEAKTEELARSLAMVRATLESTTDGILGTDAEGRITGYNQKYVAMWNLPPALLASGSHWSVLEAVRQRFADPELFMARVREIYASSPPDSFDVLECKDGTVFERFSCIEVIEGRNVGRVWSFRNVTERRRLEEVRFRLAAIVESSDDAIVSKDLNGIIRTWNKGAEQMFGYTASEVIGKPITILIPTDRLDEEPAILARLRSGERVDHFETVRRRKDGTLLDVSVTISPVCDADGRVIGASKIARDITDRKRIERDREAMLASERAARAAAERVSVMKDEFLANVSHELRTPLNSILGWSRLLASKKLSTEDFQQGIETIQRNANTQAQLIEDLLDMSRIVSGKVRLDVQQVDLTTVVVDAVNSIRPAAEVKEISLRQIFDPKIGQVTGDPTRLQQVIWNLLSNAVKFTPRRGNVEILLQRVNSQLEITISDSGLGIHPEFLPHVFERFRQADSSTTRQHGGLGLGLAIVKQLVELHGGTVSADSAGEGRGATFTVRLPLAPVRSFDIQREHPATSTHAMTDCYGLDISGVKVLVIDDEPDSRDLIQRMLQDCKADVMVAASAAEGLSKLKSARPDIILSDIGMPETDGYEFMRQLRSLPESEGGSIPALALTAFARTEDRTRALIAGYQNHIAKPVEPQELLAAVANLSGRMGRQNRS